MIRENRRKKAQYFAMTSGENKKWIFQKHFCNAMAQAYIFKNVENFYFVEWNGMNRFMPLISILKNCP